MDTKHSFEITAVIDRDTFHYDFLGQKKRFYPQIFHEAYAVMGRLNYSQEFSKIYEMASRLENATDLLDAVHAWPVPFKKFVSTYHHKDMGTDQLTDANFKQYLYEFLFTQFGSQYQPDIRFEQPIQCGQTAPEVKLSMIKFYFKPIDEAKLFLPVKEAIDKIVRDAHLITGDGTRFVWSQIFYYWLPISVGDLS
jgi:hypothetical protein